MDNLYWDRIRGFISEHKVDARWVLRDDDNDTTHGSLRIVSHPDLPPGYLRSIATFVTSIRSKSNGEILKSIDDYKMDVTELEVYSVKDNIETDQKTIEAPYSELEELYGVSIFE